jgi:hypothetical protein
MQEAERVALRHRLALGVVGTVVVVLFALLPLVLASLALNVVGAPYTQVYRLVTGHAPSPAGHSHLHLEVVSLDPWQQLLTLRASGHHVCPPGCAGQDQVLLLSLHSETGDAEGLPPSATLTLPQTTALITETVQLPVSGQPIRYPFDSYELWLGAALQHVGADGTVETLSPAEANGRLFLTIRDRLSLLSMWPPLSVDPETVHVEHESHQYLSVHYITLRRPLLLPVLTITLIMLISAAAGYAVFLQPWQQLAMSVGGLILGVWGIRSVLLPGSITYTTAIDLSLSMVVLFLLAAISIRALVTLWRRNRLQTPFRRSHGASPPDEPSTSGKGSVSAGLPSAEGRQGRARHHSRKSARRAAERAAPVQQANG